MAGEWLGRTLGGVSRFLGGARGVRPGTPWEGAQNRAAALGATAGTGLGRGITAGMLEGLPLPEGESIAGRLGDSNNPIPAPWKLPNEVQYEDRTPSEQAFDADYGDLPRGGTWSEGGVPGGPAKAALGTYLRGSNAMPGGDAYPARSSVQTTPLAESGPRSDSSREIDAMMAARVASDKDRYEQGQLQPHQRMGITRAGSMGTTERDLAMGGARRGFGGAGMDVGGRGGTLSIPRGWRRGDEQDWEFEPNLPHSIKQDVAEQSQLALLKSQALGAQRGPSGMTRDQEADLAAKMAYYSSYQNRGPTAAAIREKLLRELLTQRMDFKRQREAVDADAPGANARLAAIDAEEKQFTSDYHAGMQTRSLPEQGMNFLAGL